MAKLGDMSFTYNPTNFPNFKKIALILRKFEIGHVPMRIMEDSYSNEETFYFAEKLGGKYQHGEDITVRLASDESVGLCIAKLGDGRSTTSKSTAPRRGKIKKKLSLEYTGFDVMVNRELKDRFAPFLDHTDGFSGFMIQGTGGCNIDLETDSFKNPNACLANAKFFENSAKLWLPVLKGIASVGIINDKANININQFGKLKGKEQILETLHPQSAETVNKVIDALLFMKEKKVSSFICGPVSCSYIPRQQSLSGFGKIDIKFGGMHIIRETSVERFRYMFHPGIHLLGHFLKQDNLLDVFKYSIQKQVFRSV